MGNSERLESFTLTKLMIEFEHHLAEQLAGYAYRDDLSPEERVQRDNARLAFQFAREEKQRCYSSPLCGT